MGEKKYTRTCAACLKKYQYCAHCGEYNPREPWRYLFCSEECREIFHACSDYNQGNLSAKDAKEILKRHDIPPDDSLHPKLGETIRRIYNE